MKKQMTSPFLGSDPRTSVFVENVLSRNVGYQRYSRFLSNKLYRGSDKIYVYARYWRGEWVGTTKELYCVLYRPKA